MIWSFSPTSNSAELTLTSYMVLEQAAILKSSASENIPPVHLSRLQMIGTAENNQNDRMKDTTVKDGKI